MDFLTNNFWLVMIIGAVLVAALIGVLLYMRNKEE